MQGKYIVLFLILAMSGTLYGQIQMDRMPKHDTILYWEFPDGTIDNWAWTGGSLYLSGVFDGLGEILSAKYDHFQQVFPNADPTFWDRNRSWQRKWKNGDPSQGEAFPLSSTALVFLTDGYHLSRYARNRFMFIAIGFNWERPKKKWWYHIIDSLVYSAAYSLGFHTSYSLILNGMN